MHDLDAFATSNQTSLPVDGSANDGIEIISLKSSFGIASPLIVQQTGRPVLHAETFGRLLNTGRFDVVNFHNASLMGGPGIFALGGSALRVYTAHEHWLVCPTHILWRYKREICTSKECFRCQLTYHRPPQLWRYTGLMEACSRHIDVFIAMSEFSRSKHRDFGFSRDMEVVPPGGGTPDQAEEGESPHGRPYFFFSGRLEEAKGLQSVLPLFRRFPGADLLVAGAGSLETQLKSEGGGNIVFLGQLSPHSLAPYYRHAVATIVPSLCYETFGLVLVESLRSGTPVIARDIGPFPDIVTRSGGGILYRTDEDLLAAMHRLKDDPDDNAAMGARGRAAFLKYWQDEVTTDKYLQTIGRAMHGARAASRGP